MPDRHVMLIGFMGSGKTSVGRVLARKLSRRFVDLDAEIVSAAGCTINEIFARYGEAVFRILESEQLERVISEDDGAVISTGGGVVIQEQNRRVMKSLGITIYLKVTLEHVQTRLNGCSSRPLLTGENAFERLKILMEAREQFYADADIQIDTDGKSVEDVAMEILCSLNRFSA